jgi:hypothetical protein
MDAASCRRLTVRIADLHGDARTKFVFVAESPVAINRTQWPQLAGATSQVSRQRDRRDLGQ